MGRAAPAIFLAVAAFLLHVVLSRAVATQRSQMATLKAFGYRNRTIVAHYLQLVLWMTSAGVVVGALAGAWLGPGMVSMYADYYRFPVLDYRMGPGIVLAGLALASAVGIAATLSSVLPREGARPRDPHAATGGRCGRVRRAAVESLQRTMDETMLRMTLFNVLFAGVIAFGVVYNLARISLAEQARELATLRVLGFSRGEVSGVLLGELLVLTLLSLPLGLLAGRGLGGLMAAVLDTELYRIPLVIAPATDGFAVAVVVAAASISALVVRRHVDRLDMVAVLKAAE